MGFLKDAAKAIGKEVKGTANRITGGLAGSGYDLVTTGKASSPLDNMKEAWVDAPKSYFTAGKEAITGKQASPEEVQAKAAEDAMRQLYGGGGALGGAGGNPTPGQISSQIQSRISSAPAQGGAPQAGNVNVQQQQLMGGVLPPQLAQAVAAQGGPAAQANATQVGQSPGALAATLAGTRGVQAPTIQQTASGPAVRQEQTAVGSANQAQVGRMGQAAGPMGVVADRATVGSVAGPEGVTIGGVQLGPAALAQAAQLNVPGQMRAGQEGLLGLMGDRVAGRTPSPAEIQLQRATDRNMAQQFAMARGGGGNAGLAMRGAMNNQAMMAQDAAGQAAALRAQEQADAEGRMAGLLGQARGQDIAVGTTQAGFEQQAGLANQSALNQFGLQQGQMDLATATRNAELEAGRRALISGQDQERTLAQASIDADRNALNARLGADRQSQISAQEQARTLAQFGADTDVSKFNADAANRMQTLQAELDAARASGDATRAAALQAQMNDIAATRNLSQAQMGLTAGLANQADTLTRDTTRAGFQQQTELANLQDATTRDITNAQLGTDVSKFNAGARNDLSLADLANRQQTNIFNAGQTNQGALQTQQLQTTRDIADLNAAVSQSGLQAQLDQGVNLANLGASTQYQDLQERQRVADINALLSQRGQDLNFITGQGEQGIELGKLQNQQDAAFIGAVGKGIAAMSDRRQKKNIKRTDDPMREFLQSLDSYEYDYRDTSLPGTAKGRRYGIMAQDLEKSRAGKSLVREVDGKKMIDTAQGFGVLAAAVAHLNKRLDEKGSSKRA